MMMMMKLIAVVIAAATVVVAVVVREFRLAFQKRVHVLRLWSGALM